MVDVADLETNLLLFLRKSFSFDHSATLDGREYGVFLRTETESESKFRPRIVHLALVVPLDWVVYDVAADLFALGRDGVRPGPRGGGAASESATEAREFTEQGLAWRREVLAGGGVVYLPKELAPALFGPAALAALGLGG